MNTKYTPGPWEILKQNHNLYIGHKEPDQFALGGFRWQFVGRPFPETKSGAKRGCSPSYYGWPEKVEANARLIAAAPEMLEALRNAADALEAYAGSDESSDAEAIRALLAKIDQ